MTTERLEVRLDADRRRKLEELAEMEDESISETVRLLIDRTYDATKRERRMRAAARLVALEVEDVPDPEELSRQLNETYSAGDLY
jgi:hypothetical protein